jgi:hypothetical protein
MDSGKDIDNNADALQPDDVVVTDLEITEAKPQAKDNEETEVYVDTASDDQDKSENGMSQAQAYAAFQKEKRKRKDKQAEIDKKDAKIEALESTVSELKGQVGKITRGEMPDPYDFEDKHAYYKALKEWEGGVETPTEIKPKPANKQVDDATQAAADEADFYLYQREKDLSVKLPGYEDAKTSVMNNLRENYGVEEPSKTMTFLSYIAKQANIDIAKAIVAMDKVPGIVDKLSSIKDGNQFKMADILKNAADKVKTRSKQVVDDVPEPEITNSGPIDAVSAKVAKAREAWVKNPTSANYNAYQKVKKNSKKVENNG